MIGALIVTHGKLANELLSAAQKIEAKTGVMEAVPLEWTDPATGITTSRPFQVTVS